MASIASVYVDILPITGKIADGLKRELLKGDDDVRAAAKRWQRIIERELAGQDTKVGLTVDAKKARAAIKEAAKDQKATIEAEADTAKAESEIDRAARDRKSTIHVDVDKDRLGQMGMQAGQLFSQAAVSGAQAGTAALSGLGDAFKSVGSSGAAGAAGIAAAIPTLTALAGVAAAAAGALALLPAAFAGVGVGAGVLMIGLSGITDAYEAVSGASKDAGKDAASHARSVQSASRTVTSAQQSLTSAVRSEKQAQQDVARARRDALHELQDINDELRSGAIDETQAQLDLAKAREELATGTFESSTDYQQAQLNVIKAEDRLRRSHEDNIDLEAEAIDKRAKGVDQADQVVAAEERLATAQQNTANAQTALADAQQQLIDKQNETSNSAQKAADAMGLLSPAGQEFVTALQALTPQWDAFKQAIQQPLLEGMGPMLTATVDALLLPAITPGLQRIAGAFNDMFQEIGVWLQKPENLAMLETIVGNIATAFEKLAPAVQPMADAFGKLVEVGSGFLPGLAQSLADAATAFGDFITQAAGSGQLEQFIQTGLDTIAQFGPLLPKITDLFEKLVPLGVTFTPILVNLTGKFLDLMGSLSQFWTVAMNISPVLNTTLPAAFNLVKGAIDGVVTVARFLGDAFTFAKDLATNLGKAFMEWVTPKIEAAKEMIGLLWEGIKQKFPIIQELVDKFKSAWEGIKGFFDGAKIWMGAFFEWVKDKFLDWIPEPVKQLIKKVWPEWGGGGEVPTVSTPNNVADRRGDQPAPPPTPATPGSPAAPVPASPGGPTGGLNSREGIASYIFSSAKANGYSDSEAQAFVAQAIGESNLDPNAVGGGGKWSGIFQFDEATWQMVGGGNVKDPKQNIDNYFKLAKLRDKKTGTIRERIGNQISVGGPAAPGNVGSGNWENLLSQASGLVGSGAGTNAAVTNTTGAQEVFVVNWPSSLGGSVVSPAVPGDISASGVPNSAAVNTAAAALKVQFPGKTFDLGGSRKPGENASDTAITNRGGTAYHLSGQALDIGIGGDMALGDAVKAWAEQNKSLLGITQILWRVAGHFDHVHLTFAEGVVPQLNNAADALQNPAPIPADSHVIPLDPNIPPDQRAKAKDAGKNYGEQLGKDIVSGVMEIFGFGEFFKDPTEFGLFKIFKSFMALKPKQGTGTNASSTSTGTGNPILDLVSQVIPGGHGNSIAEDINAWQGGNNTDLAGWATDNLVPASTGPSTVINNRNIEVAGDVTPPVLNNMDTAQISNMRNFPK